MSQDPTGASRASIRRTNLGLILRALRTGGPRSRTDLSAELGLPKPTITKLVGDLIDRELVSEGERRRSGAAGRPARFIELDGHALCGLGVEIGVRSFRAVGLDLSGRVRLDRHLPTRAGRDRDRVFDALAGFVASALDELRAAGARVAGITVAAPGEVDQAGGVIVLAANLGWARVPVVAELTSRLPATAPPVAVGNDARLGAVAEYAVAGQAGIHDLIYLTGEVGVGAGIVIDGRVISGTTGYAGEVGHMPLDPGGDPCACGRRGCWETMVGVDGLLRRAADPGDPVRDEDRDLLARLGELADRAAAGDPRTLAALDRTARSLGLGLALLVDVLNPRAVVLGGYFSVLADHLLSTTREVLVDRVTAADAGGCELLVSGLGFTSAARGAALSALDVVFRDPTTVTPGAASP